MLLNKRVAFPLSSQPPSNKPQTTNNVPPAMPVTSTGPAVQPGLPPLAVHCTTERNTKEENKQQALKKEEALQRVMEGFEQILRDSAHDFEVCLLQGNFLFILGLCHWAVLTCKKRVVKSKNSNIWFTYLWHWFLTFFDLYIDKIAVSFLKTDPCSTSLYITNNNNNNF